MKELEKAVDSAKVLKFNPKRIQKKWVWEAQKKLILSMCSSFIGGDENAV